MEYNYDEMEKESKEAADKRAMLGVAGTALQGLVDAPSFYEIYKNRKVERPDVKGSFDAIAKTVSDPKEREAKKMALMKTAYENQKMKREQGEVERDSDAGGDSSLSARAWAQANGLIVNPTDTAHDLERRYGIKDLIKKKFTDRAEFDRAVEIAKINHKNQKELAGINNSAELAKFVAQQNTPSKQFDNLPEDKKATITDLAKKNAGKTSIRNQIKSVMDRWDSMPEDQRIAAGQQLIKTLNSTEGADAVGSEEAKRLAGKLTFAYGNFSNDNPTQFGRDLSGFKEQANNVVAAIDGGIKSNQSVIDAAYGRAQAPSVAPPPGGGGPGGNLANAAGGKTVMKKQFSPSRNKTRVTYSDGTTEELDGQQ